MICSETSFVEKGPLKKVVIFQFASIDGIEYFFYYDGSNKLQLHPSSMFMKVLINVGWA